MSFVAPLDGETLTGDVTLRAAASDDRGVARVEFLAGGVRIGSATAAPYEATWPTGALVNGNYFVTARATDTGGQTAEVTIQVFVGNSTGGDQPPSARLVYPVANSKVCGTITIEAAAADDVGVSQVEFFLDGQRLGVDTSSPFQKTWATAGAANGQHQLQAVATDTVGQKGQHTIAVKVDNTAGATCDNLPSVSITAPTAQYLSSATIPVTANASDDVGVVKVQFFIDNGLVGEDTTIPYGVTWSTAGFAEGAHTLKALAYDTSSQLGSDVRQVTLDLTPPAVSTTSPVSGAVVSDAFTVAMTANDAYGIDRVELRVDGTVRGTATAAPYRVNVTGAASGSHSLVATAYDRAGNSTQSAPVSVTVDKAPTVAITSPASGAGVKGVVSLTATASDDVSVARVEFFLDATSLGVDTTAPYGVSWDTNSTPNGSYALKAVATDSRGQTATAQIPISVADQAPVVSFTAPDGGASVSGQVMLAATASDDVGIVSVEFKAGGVSLATDTSAPYSATWSTCATSDGLVTLEAVATDTKGQVTTASVQVTVANATAAPVLSGRPGGGSATLTWTTCGAATGFDLYWSTAPGVTTGSTLIGAVTSPYLHTGLTNGQSYYYRVAARQGAATGPLSNEVQVVPRLLSSSGGGSWAYWRPITISASTAGAQTGYAVLVVVDTAAMVSAGKLQASCADLRFWSALGAELPWWLDSGANTAATRIQTS